MKINQETFNPFENGGTLESTNLARLQDGHRGIVKKILYEGRKIIIIFDQLFVGVGDVAGELGWREVEGRSWEISLDDYIVQEVSPRVEGEDPRLQLLPQASNGVNIRLTRPGCLEFYPNVEITASPVDSLTEALNAEALPIGLTRIPVGEDEEVINQIEASLARLLMLRRRLEPLSEGVRVGLKPYPLAEMTEELIKHQIKWTYGHVSSSVEIRFNEPTNTYVAVKKKDAQS